jgi:hypothetical protein
MRRIGLLLFVSFFAAVTLQAQIQPNFFSMGIASAGDMPQVAYGAISHPALAWTLVEGTARGTYVFVNLDEFVKKAPKDANGTALIDVTFGWTPGWAVADQSTCFKNDVKILSCTAPPDNIQDWIDFVTAVVNHYNGITAPHVAFYEIWNEMSNNLFYTGSVAQMLGLAQAAYPILKQDPYSRVVTPSVVWINGVPMMTAYLQAGGGQYADVLSFHGYPSQTDTGWTCRQQQPADADLVRVGYQGLLGPHTDVHRNSVARGLRLQRGRGLDRRAAAAALQQFGEHLVLRDRSELGGLGYFANMRQRSLHLRSLYAARGL